MYRVVDKGKIERFIKIGMTDTEIADEMDCSRRTVSRLRHNITGVIRKKSRKTPGLTAPQSDYTHMRNALPLGCMYADQIEDQGVAFEQAQYLMGIQFNDAPDAR